MNDTCTKHCRPEFDEHSEECIKAVFDYVNFGDVSRKQLGIQCQYGIRYLVGGFEGIPYLGENIRFRGDRNDYHSYRIHQDDVEKFVNRVNNYRRSVGALD
jgi:hypothetical protein